jgi:LmbE family N-acetylglucosaminyl deacetylase
MQVGKSTACRPPVFNQTSRVLVIAPHPDDESIACGLMLQTAAASGAKMSILYLTDGDNNAWPQRLMERRWRIRSHDRARWGRLRRAEALLALGTLGLGARCARFAGLPDQGLTDLLIDDANAFIGLIERAIVDLSPTHVFAPSLHDIHPDHNAAAVAVQLALRKAGTRSCAPELWTFAVHGDHARFAQNAVEMPAANGYQARKSAAIEQHRSQLQLSAKRFRSYTRRAERFRAITFKSKVAERDDVGRVVSQTPEGATVELEARPRGRWRVLLVAQDRARNPFGTVWQPSLGADVDLARVRAPAATRLRMEKRGGRAVRLTISRRDLSGYDPIYLKIDNRPVFFDHAGWIEIAPVNVARTQGVELHHPAGALAVA